MPILQTLRGRIIDLRRHANVHLYWRRRSGPAERYELWLREVDGLERQFTIHTRIMPARSGPEVTLLTDATTVRGIVNWSTGMCVNYLHADQPELLLLRDLWMLPVLVIAFISLLGSVGLLVVPPAALGYFVLAAMIRYVVRGRRASAIQRALRDVQRQDDAHRYATWRRERRD